MSTALFDVVKTAAKMTRRVIVAYSGGKDSAVTLDLCCRYFDRVDAFFMYFVKGLSFQEAQLRWAEKKYGLSILRVPHFDLSNWLACGTFRPADESVPIVTIKDIYGYVRRETGSHWIAAGERIADSIWRRAMMKKSGSIDAGRGRVYPVAHWRKSDVMAYVKRSRLKVSPESAVLGFSFRSLMPEELAKVREHYPDDYAKIEAAFPLLQANMLQWELSRGKDEASGV